MKAMNTMNTMNIAPVVVVEYNKDAFVAKCKKAVSKFINTYLTFFQMPTGMCVDPAQQQIWSKA